MARRISLLQHHVQPSTTKNEFDKVGDNGLTVSELFDTFRGKVVVVTGGSIGIGRMMAEGFVRNGAKVYISSRKKEACDETAAELTSLGPGSCHAAPADLSNEDGAVALTQFVASRESKVHVLINNAGATWGGKFDDYPAKAWDRVFDLNVKGIFMLCQKMAPLLEAAGVQGDPARIINLSSVAAYGVYNDDADATAYAYGASKAAIWKLSQTLAKVLAKRRITCNVIAPGFFPTKMNAHILRSDDMLSAVERSNPLKRGGQPGDMAGTALFLCSRAGSYINGVSIPVDGGQMHI